MISTDNVAAQADHAFTRYTAAELASQKFELTYLVDGVLVKDQPAGLVGPKKSMKTSVGIDLAVSLATGSDFLGRFKVPKPKRPLLMSGESGMATIQETAMRVTKTKGSRLRDIDMIFSDTLPRFGDRTNMADFRRFLENDAVEVVIVDPVYQCMPPDVNTANLFDVGRVLRSVNDVCREAGTTLVLVHHTKKNVAHPFAPGQLEDISWAGFQEFFRQWILLNRRKAYEPGTGMHHLWLTLGGSAGHSSQHGLDIFEGGIDLPGEWPRVWNVKVKKQWDVIADAQSRREEEKEHKADLRAKTRLERSQKKMTSALTQRPDGDTLTGLANLSGLPRSRAKEAIEVLIESGEAEICKVIKGRNKRELYGYKLANQSPSESNQSLANASCSTTEQ